MGRAELESVGLSGTTIRMSRHPRTDAMSFEFGARYPGCPDRDVYATIEIDPRRLGWDLEATLHEYPDAEDHDQEVCGLGGARVEGIDSAADFAGSLAAAAWAAVRDYVIGGCRAQGMSAMVVADPMSAPGT